MAARGRRRTRLCASTKGVWLERALRVAAREAPLERDVVRGHVGAQRRGARAARRRGAPPATVGRRIVSRAMLSGGQWPAISERMLSGGQWPAISERALVRAVAG